LTPFKSLFFGLRDLTLGRSLILTNPGNGPSAEGGKGTWKGLNVSLSGLFSYIHDAVTKFGDSLPRVLMVVNDGGERSHALIMLLGVFVALGWFDEVISYSNIVGHTHGKTDSLFGMVRKCIRKRSKRRSVTYGEIFEALQRSFPGWDFPSDYQDYGPIAVRELQCVFDWKSFFSGCRSSKLSGVLFPRASNQKLKPHVFRVTQRDQDGVAQPGVESYITGIDFMQNESRFLEWTPIFRRYPDFQRIPVDDTMFSTFLRDKWAFSESIVGSGFSMGARQGLEVAQVHYYRSFCLPACPDIHDPFFLQSVFFRSMEPVLLTRSSKRRIVSRENDNEEDDDDDRADDSVDMVKVLELKLKHGTSGQICYIQFADGRTRWVSRSDVPDTLVRDFQQQTRLMRREGHSEQAVLQRSIICDCGRAFATEHGMNIHRSKTQNEVCKKKNLKNVVQHALFPSHLERKDVMCRPLLHALTRMRKP
jgi:hypothetical protein